MPKETAEPTRRFRPSPVPPSPEAVRRATRQPTTPPKAPEPVRRAAAVERPSARSQEEPAPRRGERLPRDEEQARRHVEEPASRHARPRHQEQPLPKHGRAKGSERPAREPGKGAPAETPTAKAGTAKPGTAKAASDKVTRSPKPRRTRLATAVTFLWRLIWLTALGAGFVAVVLPWTGADFPDAVGLGGAVAITTLFTHGLAVRTGGRPILSGGLALVLAGGAVALQSSVLLAGAAVATAVVTAVLAVMATTPAAGFAAVIKEVSLAAGVGVVGAFAVRAYGAEVSLERTAYLAIGFSLLGALALVYRLGAGLQGLGRRGFVMIFSGVGLLTVTLAYTAALAQWGSPALIESIDTTFDTLRDAVGAVPRPIEVLLGFPALAWGVSTRARRRQGWWVCAFGAAGLAVLAVSLLDPGTTLLEEALSVLYSLVLGLLVGYAVIRADLYLTGARGRRARQLEELAAHRPEPGRFEPLL